MQMQAEVLSLEVQAKWRGNTARRQGNLSGREDCDRMATKKAASKSTAKTETVSEKTTTPGAPAKKTAEKKTAAKKVAAKKTATHEVSKEQSKPAAQPTHHDVATHAYLLSERDGHPHGKHDEYWHRAERELKS